MTVTVIPRAQPRYESKVTYTGRTVRIASAKQVRRTLRYEQHTRRKHERKMRSRRGGGQLSSVRQDKHGILARAAKSGVSPLHMENIAGVVRTLRM